MIPTRSHTAITLSIAATAAALLVAACAPLDVAAPPVSRLTLPAKVNRGELEEGRRIYASSCTRCHGPARIDRRGDAKWARILPRMCQKARLTAEQSRALNTYVTTARQALAAPGAE